MIIAFNVTFLVFLLTTGGVIAGCLSSEIARLHNVESMPPRWIDYLWIGATVIGAATIALAFLTLQPLYAAIYTYAVCITWMVGSFRIERGWGIEDGSYRREFWTHILAPFVLAINIAWGTAHLLIGAYRASWSLFTRNTGRRAK